MPASLETLKNRKETITEELNQLKTLAENQEKEQKQQKIATEIIQLNSDIKAYIDQATDQAQKAEAEKLVEELNRFSSELKTLEQEVMNDQESNTTTLSKQTPKEEQASSGQEETSANQGPSWIEKEKNFLQRGVDWINGDENEEHHTAKTIGRGALVASGVGIGIYGLGRLFGWRGKKKEKKNEDATTENTEKKGFWDKRYGKTLKWIGIWTGVGAAGYYLGKWFGRWWGKKKPKDTASDEEKYVSYKEFIEKNPEAKEKYELFGENVDAMYEGFYQQELDAGYQDELEMGKIAKEQSWGLSQLKGIVPYCLDNKFGTIEEILAQNSSFKNVMWQGLNEMLKYIKSLGTDFLQMFVDSFLSKLPSWSLVSSLSGSLTDKLEKWKVENQRAGLELQYFFRQGIRIQAYLFEKKDQLVDKIATEAASRCGRSKSEIMRDEKHFDQYVIKDPQYQAFVGSAIVNGVKVLEDKAIFDAEVGENIKITVKNLDKERKEILGAKAWEKDILQTIAEKKQNQENLTQEEKEILASSCDGIVKNVDDDIIDAVEEGAWNIYGDLLRMTDDPNIREYVNNAGLLKVFEEFKTKITEKKRALQEGHLSNEEIYALSDMINAMLALKKEVMLWAATIERDYDENGNIIYRIPWFLADSILNLKTAYEKFWDGERLSAMNYLASAGLGTGVSLMLVGGVVYVVWGKVVGKVMMKTGLTIATFLPSMLYKWGKLVLSNSLYAKKLGDKLAYKSPKWIQSMNFFRGEKWPSALMEALKTGKIGLADAEDILARKLYGTWAGKNLDLRKIEFDIIEQGKRWSINLSEKIFDNFASSSKLGNSFLTNLKKDPELYNKLIKYFDEDPRIANAIIADEPLEKLRSYVDEIEAKRSAAVVSEAIDWVDDAWRVADDVVEATADVLKKNSIFNDLGEQKRLLDVELERLHKLSTKWPLEQARITKLERQLTELENFEKQLRAGGDEVAKQTSELLTLLKGKWKSLSTAIEQLDILKNLEGEKFISTIIDPKTGKGMERSLDEVISSLDAHALRSLKGQKIAGVTDESLEMLAKSFDEIRNLRNTKNFFVNADDFVAGIKNLVKVFAKMT